MSRETLPREDWQWLADQLRAWPVKRVHPGRTMSDGALRPMAADTIEAAMQQMIAMETALMAVVTAVREYMPPGGHVGRCLNRVIEAIDNPTINPVIAEIERRCAPPREG